MGEMSQKKKREYWLVSTEGEYEPGNTDEKRTVAVVSSLAEARRINREKHNNLCYILRIDPDGEKAICNRTYYQDAQDRAWSGR